MKPLRIIFVDDRHKFGMSPLSLNTPQGQLAEMMMNRLKSTEDDAYPPVYVKSSLLEEASLPEKISREFLVNAVEAWKKRTDFSDEDIVVSLGAIANRAFLASGVHTVKLSYAYYSGLENESDRGAYFFGIYESIVDEFAMKVSSDNRSEEYLKAQGYDVDKLIETTIARAKIVQERIQREKSANPSVN